VTSVLVRKSIVGFFVDKKSMRACEGRDQTKPGKLRVIDNELQKLSAIDATEDIFKVRALPVQAIYADATT